MKKIAVQGMTLVMKPPHTGVIFVFDPPSTRLAANGLGAFLDGTRIQVTNIITPGFPIPDPGPYLVPLVATALRSRSTGLLVLREGDESDPQAFVPKLINPAPPPDFLEPVPPVSFIIQIAAAGQSRSLAS